MKIKVNKKEIVRLYEKYPSHFMDWPEFVEVEPEPVEPDATSGERCCGSFTGVGLLPGGLCTCPCHLKQPEKQTPTSPNSAFWGFSDERRDNPHTCVPYCPCRRFVPSLELPKKMKWQHDNGKVGVSNEEIMHKVNAVIEFLALQEKG